MGGYSRRVLAWKLSNTLDTQFCVGALQQVICDYGRPEIFNSDQGYQFTSSEFTSVLADQKICISMDGKGRWMGNAFIEGLWRSLKYECVHLGHRTRPIAAYRRWPRQRNQSTWFHLIHAVDLSRNWGPAALDHELSLTQKLRTPAQT